jgi:hypothetical protein
MGAVAAGEKVGVLLASLEVMVEAGYQVVLHHKVVELFV